MNRREVLTRIKEFLVNFSVASLAVGAYSQNWQGVALGFLCLGALFYLAAFVKGD